MKCMKHFASKEVIRVSDEKAAAMRAADPLEPKAWQFVPKYEWKMNVRDSEK